MSGDMRVKLSDPNAVTAMAKNQSLETIDAHSKASGNMTVERQVGGKSVYLTEEGAAAFDQLTKQG